MSIAFYKLSALRLYTMVETRPNPDPAVAIIVALPPCSSHIVAAAAQLPAACLLDSRRHSIGRLARRADQA
jgi:hypothetical protein